MAKTDTKREGLEEMLEKGKKLEAKTSDILRETRRLIELAHLQQLKGMAEKIDLSSVLTPNQLHYFAELYADKYSAVLYEFKKGTPVVIRYDGRYSADTSVSAHGYSLALEFRPDLIGVYFSNILDHTTSRVREISGSAATAAYTILTDRIFRIKQENESRDDVPF